MTSVLTHDQDIDRFLEQLGRLAEGEGLPRIAGRMMGLLMVEGTPLSIDDLAKRLRVSRASVSTNSRLLQSLSVAALSTQPGNRRDYLQICGNPCSSLMMIGLRRMQSMLDAIRRMRTALVGARFARSRLRLKHLERFYEVAIAHVEALLDSWDDLPRKARRRRSRRQR